MLTMNRLTGKIERPKTVAYNIARPYVRLMPAGMTRSLNPFTPPQMAKRYAFPDGTDGTGETIGILELGGGYSKSALATYWPQIGVKVPTIQDFLFSQGQNAPGSDADGEVCGDICVAGGAAPGAKLVVGFAENSDVAFYGLHRALIDQAGATVVSISWGGPEPNWSSDSMAAFAASIAYGLSKGVITCIAAGDNDQGDGLGGRHADFPGTAPGALCVGGTTIRSDGSEIVWNTQTGVEGTGGGYSAVFPTPAYQKPLNPNPNRLVPDVTALGDPNPGYLVQVGNQMTGIGGTSMGTPLMAALIARLRQALKRPVGIEEIYAAASTFSDITVGTND